MGEGKSAFPVHAPLWGGVDIESGTGGLDITGPVGLVSEDCFPSNGVIFHARNSALETYRKCVHILSGEKDPKVKRVPCIPSLPTQCKKQGCR